MDKKIREIAAELRQKYNKEINEEMLFRASMSIKEIRDEFLKNIKKAKEKCKEIAKDINTLSFNELKKIKSIAKEKRKKELEFPKIEINGEVITAYPPDPSKYAHIGHAYAAYINRKFAKMHKGKFILRFEDTNAKIVKKEYYDAIIEDLAYLDIKADEIVYASEYLEKLYDEARKFIKKDLAYVCFCDAEKSRKLRKEKKECSCRSKSIEENLRIFEEMVKKKYKEGSAQVRLKIDMQSKKAEFRDPAIFRIIDEEHPIRKKQYNLWPSYIWQNTFLDYYNKVSHRFRSKEFEQWKAVQQFIAEKAGFKIPYIYEYARINIEGAITKGREIRKLIENGARWDDPRLLTIRALRRKAICKEAIIDFIEKMGLSKTESKLKIDTLYSFNRKYLNNVKKIAFLANLDIAKVKNEEFFYDKSKIIENQEYRLRHLFNVVFKDNNLIYKGNEIKKGVKMLTYIKKPVEITIINEENKEIKGYIEKNTLKENEVIYLENFAFVKIESLKPLKAIYMHK